MRVWYNGRTSAFQADDAGSIPATRSIVVGCLVLFAHIAQSVEHFLGKEEVTGSNPVMSSIYTVWGFPHLFFNLDTGFVTKEGWDNGKGKV